MLNKIYATKRRNLLRRKKRKTQIISKSGRARPSNKKANDDANKLNGVVTLFPPLSASRRLKSFHVGVVAWGLVVGGMYYFPCLAIDLSDSILAILSIPPSSSSSLQ